MDVETKSGSAEISSSGAATRSNSARTYNTCIRISGGGENSAETAKMMGG